MTISLSRARQCVGRPIIFNTDDHDGCEGVITRVEDDRVFARHLGDDLDAIADVSMLSWKPILPVDLVKHIVEDNRGWSEDGWMLDGASGTATLVQLMPGHWERTDESRTYLDVYAVSPHSRVIALLDTRYGSIWAALQIEEAFGWKTA